METHSVDAVRLRVAARRLWAERSALHGPKSSLFACVVWLPPSRRRRRRLRWPACATGPEGGSGPVFDAARSLCDGWAHAHRRAHAGCLTLFSGAPGLRPHQCVFPERTASTFPRSSDDGCQRAEANPCLKSQRFCSSTSIGSIGMCPSKWIRHAAARLDFTCWGVRARGQPVSLDEGVVNRMEHLDGTAAGDKQHFSRRRSEPTVSPWWGSAPSAIPCLACDVGLTRLLGDGGGPLAKSRPRGLPDARPEQVQMKLHVNHKAYMCLVHGRLEQKTAPQPPCAAFARQPTAGASLGAFVPGVCAAWRPLS